MTLNQQLKEISKWNTLLISCAVLVYIKKKKSSSSTGLDRPRGLQEVKVPRFLDNGTGWW